MQNKRKLIYLVSLGLFVSTTLFGCGLSHAPQEFESQAVESESEVFLETETEVLSSPTETKSNQFNVNINKSNYEGYF